ncbi:MAG: DUF1080 domain-containing protein [Verrucomicrobiota bacterium]|nr:DUF1080 domain-containing protein [Verrucomicrobiota bacterium]
MKKQITILIAVLAISFIFSPLLLGGKSKTIQLFNGKDLDNWIQQKPGGWIVEKGMIASSNEPGGYIWAKGDYGNFELELDFKVSKGCNSGVFFRADPKNPVQGGFEIQILDSYGKTKIGKHDCGALYDAMAPSINRAKPAGEWNQMKLVVNDSYVKVILNGDQVINANLDQWTVSRKNPDESRNKFRIALKDLPRAGSIGLQYHGKPVWFKNIQLKAN